MRADKLENGKWGLFEGPFYSRGEFSTRREAREYIASLKYFRGVLKNKDLKSLPVEQKLPPGWTQKKVAEILKHYEGQTQQETGDQLEELASSMKEAGKRQPSVIFPEGFPKSSSFLGRPPVCPTGCSYKKPGCHGLSQECPLSGTKEFSIKFKKGDRVWVKDNYKCLPLGTNRSGTVRPDPEGYKHPEEILLQMDAFPQSGPSLIPISYLELIETGKNDIEFKEGDRVRIIDPHSPNKGREGTMTSPKKSLSLVILDGDKEPTDWYNSNLVLLPKAESGQAEEQKKAFKVGDRVKIIYSGHPGTLNGKEGTIVYIPYVPGSVGVMLDGQRDQEWCSPENLELLPPKVVFKPGDQVLNSDGKKLEVTTGPESRNWLLEMSCSMDSQLVVRNFFQENNIVPGAIEIQESHTEGEIPLPKRYSRRVKGLTKEEAEKIARHCSSLGIGVVVYEATDWFKKDKPTKTPKSEEGWSVLIKWTEDAEEEGILDECIDLVGTDNYSEDPSGLHMWRLSKESIEELREYCQEMDLHYVIWEGSTRPGQEGTDNG